MDESNKNILNISEDNLDKISGGEATVNMRYKEIKVGTPIVLRCTKCAKEFKTSVPNLAGLSDDEKNMKRWAFGRCEECQRKHPYNSSENYGLITNFSGRIDY